MIFFPGGRGRHNDQLVKTVESQAKKGDFAMDREENWKNSYPIEDFFRNAENG